MDEIRKLYKESITSLMKDTMSEKEIDEYVEFMTEKTKTVKKGDNVLHLTYYKGLITEQDLLLFQKELQKSNIELSSYDNTGTAQNSLQDFLNHFVLVIAPALLDNIIFGIAGNAAWDTIKGIAKTVWKKTKGQKINQISGRDIKEKEITFGVTASLGEGTKYDFRIDGNLSDETVLTALDKILDFLKKQEVETKCRGHQFSRFNTETNDWVVLDIFEEIKKIHAKQNGH